MTIDATPATFAPFGRYAEYYDLCYADRDYTREVDFVRRAVERHAPAARSLLDLGCGTGEHGLCLAEGGLEVVGIDRSPGMIARARTRSPRIAPRTMPAFEVADARTFRAARRFDVVTALFHVVSYQTADADLAAVLATARAHLAPGGIFVFDFWYGPAVVALVPERRVKRVEADGVVVVREAEPVMIAGSNVVEVRYRVRVDDPARGTEAPIEERHRMRYLFDHEVDEILGRAGLRELERAEWLTGAAPGPATWSVYVVAGADSC